VTIDEEFQVLYERELPNVFRAVLLLCGDRGIAEDAAQEAFARALARWRRLGGQPWVGGWVMTTALNVARRQLRRRPPPPPVPAPDHDPESLMDARAAIRTLPPRQQEAVALHYLLDLPVADTAVVMGCDEGTVKTHLSRARSTLRTALAIDDEPTDQRSTRHG
jgi:RNA polymerase sigma-70 factor (ECF subfamily)